MKNKKGFVGIIALFILILIVLLAFVVSSTFRWTVIGIGVIAGAIIYIAPAALSGEFTNRKIVFVLLVIFTGVIIIVIPNISMSEYASHLSIDKIDNVGVGSEFLVFSSIGSSERLQIDWSKDDFNNKLDEGYMVDRGVDLDIELVDWKHKFPIQFTNKKFYEIGKQDLVQYAGSEMACELSDCNNKIPENERLGTYIACIPRKQNIYLSWDCDCIYYKPVADIGDFATGNQKLNYDIEFNIDGEKRNLTEQHKSIELKNGNIRVEYVGSFGTNEEISSPNYDVLREDSIYTDLLEDDSYQINGIDTPGTWLVDCEPDTNAVDTYVRYSAKDKIYSCIDEYNDISRDARDDSQISTYENLLGGKVSFDLNNMILSKPRLTFRPAFKMFINADWIGLKELRGEPKIIKCAEDIKTDSITEKPLTMEVQNIGDEPGFFEYKVDCLNEDVSVYGEIGEVDKNEIKEVKLVFIGGNSDKNKVLKGQCTHTITDLKSQKTVSCVSNFEVESSDGSTCLYPSKRCNPLDMSVLQKCKMDGTGWEDDLICQERCYYNKDISDFECKDGKISESDNKDRDSCLSQNKEGSNRYQWIPPIDYPWYQFWNKDKAGYCKDTWVKYYVLIGVGVIGLILGMFTIYVYKPKGVKNK